MVSVPSSTTAKKVREGTLPFRGVPRVPSPPGSLVTNLIYQPPAAMTESFSLEQQTKQARGKPGVTRRITDDLLRAAMRRCDQFGDDEAAREQMRRDCLALPVDLQAELLAHFTQEKP